MVDKQYPPEFKGEIVVTRKMPDGTEKKCEVTGTVAFTHEGKVTAIRYDDRPQGLIPLDEDES